MYAEQNSRNTGNETQMQVSRREKKILEGLRKQCVLMRQVAADNSQVLFCLCFVEITLSADICDRTIGYAHNHQNSIRERQASP